MKIIFASILLALSLNLFAQGFLPVANVTKISGMAFINNEKIAEGKEVAEGMIISIPKKGDFVEIKFQNGHLLRLVGAKVVVSELNPKTTLFQLIRGKIFSSVNKLTPNEKFTIKTSNSAFAVRGTRFFVEASKSSSYLCVCEGVVAAKSGKKTIDVSKNEDLTVEKGKKLNLQPASTRMIDMSNAVFKEMGLL